MLRELISRLGPVIALVLLGIYLSLASPHFLRTDNMVNITRQSSVTAILAVGQTLVILTSGIDLSVGAIAAISASAASVLMTQRIVFLGMAIGPLGFLPGLLVALVIGALAGALNGLIITKGRIPDFIATLGTLTIFQGIALLITGGLPVPSHLTATDLKGRLPPQMIWMGAGDIMGIPIAGLIAVLIVSWAGSCSATRCWGVPCLRSAGTKRRRAYRGSASTRRRSSRTSFRA
jgi:ribose/xylose/arabinose/galactoside ABC-type transport system permease subunit